MRRGDLADPLLRQVLPIDDERRATAGYSADPLQEANASRAPGLIQKYHGRALLIVTGACAVHCRYCFRRNFPNDAHRQDISFPALDAVANDPSLNEVILSGGDPLMLKDTPLRTLVGRLERIPHVRRLRIHTRLPVVIPHRVTADLLAMLAERTKPMTVVVHVNHANEIDGDLGRAIERIASTGVTLLNQSVLLAGVNDDADELTSLSERLHTFGALPYYLHLLDRVTGTAHFDVPEARARALVGEVTRRLPGYLVPRLAREVPGHEAKEVLPSI